jgi:hypothetical protein
MLAGPSDVLVEDSIARLNPRKKGVFPANLAEQCKFLDDCEGNRETSRLDLRW